MQNLIGIHAVTAALRSAHQTGLVIDRVTVAEGTRNSRLTNLIKECRELGIPVRFAPGDALQRMAGSTAHQGIIALTAGDKYSSLDSVLEDAPEVSTLVVLDSVQDPRNLGAILRTAEAAGATALIVPERRSAELTETATKAAAGALQSLPVVRVKNLNRALDRLKKEGYWIYGFDAEAETLHDAVTYTARNAIVLGGESNGMREKVAGRCDFLIRIPLSGTIPSLNVSVAAGIALFEIARQRRMKT